MGAPKRVSSSKDLNELAICVSIVGIVVILLVNLAVLLGALMGYGRLALAAVFVYGFATCNGLTAALVFDPQSLRERGRTLVAALFLPTMLVLLLSPDAQSGGVWKSLLRDASLTHVLHASMLLALRTSFAVFISRRQKLTMRGLLAAMSAACVVAAAAAAFELDEIGKSALEHCLLGAALVAIVSLIYPLILQRSYLGFHVMAVMVFAAPLVCALAGVEWLLLAGVGYIQIFTMQAIICGNPDE